MIFNLVVLLQCSSCLLWCLSDRMDIYTLNQKSSHFSLSMTKMSKMTNANLPSHDRLPMPFMYLHSAAHQRASYLMHDHINSLPQFLFIDLCFSFGESFYYKNSNFPKLLFHFIHQNSLIACGKNWVQVHSTRVSPFSTFILKFPI